MEDHFNLGLDSLVERGQQILLEILDCGLYHQIHRGSATRLLP